MSSWTEEQLLCTPRVRRAGTAHRLQYLGGDLRDSCSSQLRLGSSDLPRYDEPDRTAKQVHRLARAASARACSATPMSASSRGPDAGRDAAFHLASWLCAGLRKARGRIRATFGHFSAPGTTMPAVPNRRSTTSCDTSGRPVPESAADEDAAAFGADIVAGHAAEVIGSASVPAGLCQGRRRAVGEPSGRFQAQQRPGGDVYDTCSRPTSSARCCATSMAAPTGNDCSTYPYRSGPRWRTRAATRRSAAAARGHAEGVVAAVLEDCS